MQPNNLTKKEKRQAAVVFIALLLFIGLCLFFCLIFSIKVVLIWVLPVIIVAEYIAQVWMYRKIRTPLVDKIYSFLLRLYSKISAKFKSKVVAPEPAAPAKTPIKTDISKIMLSKWIDVMVDGNLSVLGEGSKDELDAAWSEIVSDFYKVSGDSEVGEHTKLTGKIRSYAQRIEQINFNYNILKMRRSAAAMRGLQSIKDYAHLKFTNETLADDLKYIDRFERSKKLEYERWEMELKQLETDSNPNKKKNLKPKREYYHEQVMNMNKAEGSQYRVDKLTVMDYALLEKRLRNYYKAQEEQIRKMKHGGR